MEPEGSLPCSQEPSTGPYPEPKESIQVRGFLWSLVTNLFFRWVVSPTPNPQARGPPFVSSPRLFIQYIRSYPPYLMAVSSIRNLRTTNKVLNEIAINSLVKKSTVNEGEKGKKR
jgi:hypothetical protein